MKGELISNLELGAKLNYITIAPAESIAPVEPGAFVMIRPSSRAQPYLPRPIGIADRARDGSTFSLLIQTVGMGTKNLAALRADDQVEFSGPFGERFFEAPGSDDERIWLVAGGVGLAPFILYLKLYASPNIALFFGAASRERIVLFEKLSELLAGRTLEIATDDGSLGHHGSVVDLLARRLDRLEALDRPLKIYTCGPHQMMRAVGETASSRSIRAFCSLETMMGCGFGVCLGCAVETRESEKSPYLIVCSEGPVIENERIRF